MARALTVARVRVPASRQEEYLQVLSELEVLGRPSGRHLWAFRSSADPELFLEFSESRTLEAHPAVAAPSQREAALALRLERLAPRDALAGELWHETPLPVTP